MDLEGIMLNEISEAEKDKYPDLTFIWKLKMKAKTKKLNLQIQRTDWWLPEVGVDG